jgi:glucose/arabinose dehydrogenase
MQIFRSKFLIFIEAIIVALVVLLLFLYQGSKTKDNTTSNTSSPQQQTNTNQSENSEPGKTASGKAGNTTGLPLKVPNGFSIGMFAENLNNPRVILFDKSNNLLVSETSAGRVSAISLKNGKKQTVVDNILRPHGLEILCTDSSNCKLYVAATDAIYTYKYEANDSGITVSERQKILDLPSGGNHFTRSLKIFNNKLLISVGSTCNVCNESDSRRAKILVSDLDGKNLKDYAVGLRNSVFMTESPFDKNIWATEMGRDMLGDNTPPEEVNIIQEGKNYGWPICYGKNIHDTNFDKNTYFRNPCQEPTEIPSHIDMQAHSAPLGLAFIPDNEKYPQEYRKNLLVAFHGSWNRTVRTGYKIERFILNEKGEYVRNEPFIEGWLSNNILGRPVDIKIDPHSLSMFVTDDNKGVIYKINYEGN